MNHRIIVIHDQLFYEWCKYKVGLPKVLAPKVPKWHILRRFKWIKSRKRKLLKRGKIAWHFRWKNKINKCKNEITKSLMLCWYESGIDPDNEALNLTTLFESK